MPVAADAGLAQVLIVYETEAAARGRLVRHGYAPDVAGEIAVYLAQATDLPDYFDEIRGALAAEGLDVGFAELDRAVEAMGRLDPARAVVWCQTDGIRFYRGSAVPALARLLAIPSYGSPPHVQHLCQDKFASLALASAAGLRVPSSLLLENDAILAGAIEDEGGDLFVKPATLGAKIGIVADSRCRGLDEARRLSRRIWDRYADRALVQPFVEGDDVRVSFLDTGGSFASQLGIARLAKDPASETGGAFMTMRDNASLSGAKDTSGRRGAFGRHHEAAFVPAMADLSADGNAQGRAIAAAVGIAAARLARLLPLRDYFSMDFRVDPAGAPFFLEFETCPAVTIYDFQHYLQAVHHLTLGPALARSLRLAHARGWSRVEA